MKKNRRRVPITRTPDAKPVPPRLGSTRLQVSPEQVLHETERPTAPLVEIGPPLGRVPLLAGLVVAGVALLWSYWPTWVALATTWEREPDYSHGWFVVPIAAYLLWSIRDSMPRPNARLHWMGVLLLAVVIGLRVFARWAYFDFLDGWTLPVAAIAFCWLFCGWNVTKWAMPALIFLFFMVPLPFRIENELSRPLQWFATKASCFTLQLLGQPAISEGTTILLGDQTLEVERACSGLRIFMGVFALSYVYAFLVRRVWWERGLLIISAVPIALIANASRIVMTGLSYKWFSSQWARHLAHDWAGYIMILYAAMLFGLMLLYLRWVLPDTETLESTSLNRL